MRKKGGPEFECLWFSPGTPASSTTKTGRHDIVEILLKVALNTKKNQSINQSINHISLNSLVIGIVYNSMNLKNPDLTPRSGRVLLSSSVSMITSSKCLKMLAHVIHVSPLKRITFHH